MLGLAQLRHLFEDHGTPPAGRKLIEDARRNAPVRKVQSNSNNVITRFASRKMERMVDTEKRVGPEITPRPASASSLSRAPFPPGDRLPPGVRRLARAEP